MEFVAIDFETDDFGEPWQLGAVEFEPEGGVCREGERRDWRFKNQSDIWAQWEEITKMLAGKTLVAHNTACEKTILTRLAPLTPWGPWRDTLKMARRRYPKLKSYELGALCETFGCVPEMDGRTWHDGLYDAVACGRLYAKIA